MFTASTFTLMVSTLHPGTAGKSKRPSGGNENGSKKTSSVSGWERIPCTKHTPHVRACAHLEAGARAELPWYTPRGENLNFDTNFRGHSKTLPFLDRRPRPAPEFPITVGHGGELEDGVERAPQVRQLV